ncbi:MAG: lysis system i-spanin subunit Rz [Parvibaculum sedimenti]|uniref:lysis system i-spanin subunit Rz n=1 Tax=Parvibaculum sedimenti TaxID=2608632 RepID=UPI003BB5F9C1
MKLADIISFTSDAIGGWKGYALAAAVAFAIGGTAAGAAAKVYYDGKIAALERANAEAAADQARIALAEMVRLSAIISGIDADYYKELQNEKLEGDKLRAALRAGTLRLRAHVASCLPASASATGVDHGGAGDAELEGATSESLAAIADDGDQAIVKLNGCRAYARALQPAGGGN